MLHVAWLLTWLGLALEPESIGKLFASVGPTFLLALPVAMYGNLLHVWLRIPAVRWPRTDKSPGPKPLPLGLAGAPSLLLWPLMAARDRRARAPDPPAQEVEVAFRELLALPRVAASSLLLW